MNFFTFPGHNNTIGISNHVTKPGGLETSQRRLLNRENSREGNCISSTGHSYTADFFFKCSIADKTILLKSVCKKDMKLLNQHPLFVPIPTSVSVLLGCPRIWVKHDAWRQGKSAATNKPIVSWYVNALGEYAISLGINPACWSWLFFI